MSGSMASAICAGFEQNQAAKRSILANRRASGDQRTSKAANITPLGRSQNIAGLAKFQSQQQQQQQAPQSSPAAAANANAVVVSSSKQVSMRQSSQCDNGQVLKQAKCRQIAPLASLDCSITEPIIDGSPPGSQSADTPTLSGYFDCDQLSDMVDDSLFEITAAGCLSKSVFKLDSDARSKTGSSVSTKQVTNELSADESAQTEEADDEDNNEDDDLDEAGSVTPTNERFEAQLYEENDNNNNNNNNSNNNNSKKLAVIQGQKEANCKAQMTLLSNYQKPSYHIENRHRHQQAPSSGSDSPAAAVVGHRQRSKSARFNSASAAGSSAKGGDDAADIRPTTQSASNEQHRVRRKTRSNPDVRGDNDGPENVCSICRQSVDSSSVSSSSMTTATATATAPTTTTTATAKKREKKRFTFSLFNLFMSGTSGSNDNNQSNYKQEEICRHQSNSAGKPQPSSAAAAAAGCYRSSHQQCHSSKEASNGEQLRASATSRHRVGHRHRLFDSSANGAINSAGTRTQIKSRDSIKLTNQRKRRNNNAVRLSTSYNDFQADEPTELLLDFSRQSATSTTTLPSTNLEEHASMHELKTSQSSNNIRLYSRDNQTINGIASNNKDARSLLTASKLQQRPTKSVKFTTPDRVMIMPKSLNKPSGCCSNLPPPANRLPSAPIIKRPIPKASSYSQTESNKSLLELLAKYDENSELILEINEKLKLTETIASPISALDQVVVTSNNEKLTKLTSDAQGFRK